MDLVRIPHLLVGGMSGYGKTSLQNKIICDLARSKSPEELRFVMLDTKCVEFCTYNKLPHLAIPVLSDMEECVWALGWLSSEMDRRFDALLKASCRNITMYRTAGYMMPYIVVVIDEIANLMEDCWAYVSPAIVALTAKGRAVGIHLVVTTNSRDERILSQLGKANLRMGVVFRVKRVADSVSMIGDEGAESLRFPGEMLVRQFDDDFIRATSPYVSDEKQFEIVSWLRNKHPPHLPLDISQCEVE